MRRALPVLLAQRFVVNTGGRMVLTYLPVLARGSGLSLETMGRLVFARDITGLAGPWVGRVVRRRGAWWTMTLTGLLAAVGMVLVSFGSWGLMIGLVLWGGSRTAYLVAGNSWIGDVVAYERRGRATGLVELTWAAAALVGLPAMGLLMQVFGWRAAPIALALLGLPLSLWSYRTEVPDGGRASVAAVTRRRARPATLVALTAIALLLGAAQFLFFSHGLWLADTYDFDAAAVGFAIVVVGFAEATASIGTYRLTDRLGKRVAVITGGSVLTAALALFALLPAPPLAAGLALLVLAFLGSEFAIVSSISLTSELEPDNRSAVIGLGTGMLTVARASVSLIAGALYGPVGFGPLMAAAALLAAGSVAVLTLAVREPGD